MSDHRIGQRRIWLLCLALGVGVSSTAVARADVSLEVRDSKAELEKEIETELAKTPELQPAQRGVLTALIVNALEKKAFDLAVKFIQNKHPNFTPSTDDMQFVTGLASKVITNLVDKMSPLTGLHPKLKDTNLLVQLLSSLRKNTKATRVDDFITEAQAKVKNFLGIDILTDDDKDEIADKARGAFGAEPEPTQPVPSADSILGDEANKKKIIERLSEMDADNLSNDQTLSEADRISKLKAAISATRNNMFDVFLRDDVTQGKKTKFADLSAADQKTINEVLIPEVVQKPVPQPPEPGDGQGQSQTEPTTKPPTRIRKKPPTSSASSSSGRLYSYDLGNAVIVPRCRLFRGLSSRRAVILQDSGLSRSLGSRYVIIGD